MIERNEQARKLLAQGVNLITDIVKETLGPKGKNVILFENDKAFTTKDGISIATRVYSDNHAVEAGIQLAREASAKTAKQAGDGSTTSLILTQAFFNIGQQLLEKSSIIEVKKYLTDLVNKVKTYFSSFRGGFCIDEFQGIARISANNDEEIANLVATAFEESGENGTITFELDEVLQSYVETIEGSRYPLPIVAKEFFTSEGRQEACYDNPFVLLLGTEVKNINQLKPALQLAANQHKAIVIFATDFSPLVLTQLYRNYSAGYLNVVPIKVLGYAGNRTDTLHDLSALTGADVYDVVPSMSQPKLGTCDKVVSTLQGTTILVREPSENYQIRIGNLEEMISREQDDTVKAFMEQRLTQLKGKISIIHVGGKTEVEAKERYDRVEDAVCAVKSSIEEGTCIGGGYTYLDIYKQCTENPFAEALKEPFEQLCRNSGLDPKYTLKCLDDNECFNFFIGKKESVDFTLVLDPVKVVRLSIENAASVALMLLTTESIIYNE